MFRWVYCQIETLRPCFPTSIRLALDELAQVLGGTYEQTLRRIDKEKRDYTYCIDCSSASSYPSAHFVSRVSRNSRSSLQFIQPNVGTIPAFDAYGNLHTDDPVAVLLYRLVSFHFSRCRQTSTANNTLFSSRAFL